MHDATCALVCLLLLLLQVVQLAPGLQQVVEPAA
jgi:hypothetical protein